MTEQPPRFGRFPFSYCPKCGFKMRDYESGGHMKCPECDIYFTVIEERKQ